MTHHHSYNGRIAAPAAPRWRAALDALIGAPVRLHRYRHLHAEVIEDALRAFDGGPQRDIGK
jgi:hypothetical protein